MSNLEGVPYIEPSDFNPDMSLKPYVGKGKPVLVMLQSMSCGHCSQAKPAFQELHNSSSGQFVTATMQLEEFNPEMVQKLDPQFRGVPTYWIFDASGRFARVHDGGRDVQTLRSVMA